MIDYVKYPAILAILGLLIVFWQYDRKSAYDAGYNAAILDINESSIEYTGKEIKSAELKIKAAEDKLLSQIKINKEWQENNEKINKLLNDKEKVKKEIVYVDKIIKDSSCRDFGNDFVQLWNSKKHSSDAAITIISNSGKSEYGY